MGPDGHPGGRRPREPTREQRTRQRVEFGDADVLLAVGLFPAVALPAATALPFAAATGATIAAVATVAAAGSPVIPMR